MIATSVIICAHNPRAHFLEQVLQALREQVLPKEEWELLLVDNGSATPLSESVDLSWHPHGRHLREMALGLTPARVRGILEAKGELLIFVDDDNVLQRDYLAHAKVIATRHAAVGVWSGNVRLDFQEPPPEWTRPYWPWLTAREISQDVISRPDTSTPNMPYGAGLCVRREVGLMYHDHLQQLPIRQLLDRKGQALISGGDTDIALTAGDMGMEVGLFARLEVKHLIPPERLTEEYLLRLRRGVMTSYWLLQFLRGKGLQRLPKGAKWWTKFIYDSARKRGRQRRFYMAEALGKRDAWIRFAALKTEIASRTAANLRGASALQ
jgi:glycosyltransferase involved in cell wall biosynthesis